MYALAEWGPGATRAAIVRGDEVSDSLERKEETNVRSRAVGVRKTSAADRDRAEPGFGTDGRPVERYTSCDVGWKGRLAIPFDRDQRNMTGIQRGSHSIVISDGLLGRYQEARIRHFRRLIDDFIIEKQG